MKRASALLAILLGLGLGAALPAQPLPPQDSAGAPADSAVVAGPIPEKVTASSVVVWWQTTAPEESILIYGTAPGEFTYRVQRPWRTTTHEVSLKKLQPATTYYLAILQPDGTRSALSQFTTQPAGYAGQSGVRITNGPLFEQITPDSATIAWSTNRPSSFVVRYGADPQNLNQTAKAPWTPTTHRVTLPNLRSDTHYYFTIEANQSPAGGEEQAPELLLSAAQVYAFRTLARGQQALNIGPQH